MTGPFMWSDILRDYFPLIGYGAVVLLAWLAWDGRNA